MNIKTSLPKFSAIVALAVILSTVNTSAATFTVINTNDSGAGSLRQAILNANAAAGDDIIAFDSSFNVPRTITVGGTLMTITGSGALTINGPGMNLLTVDGNSASRIFEVSGVNSPSIGTVTFNNLTITNGFAVSSGDGNGAGIGINNGNSEPPATFVPVVINNVLFRTNFGGVNAGGGIGCIRSGSLTVNNSVFTGNGANNGGAIVSGSGIGVCSVEITNSSFYENQIEGAGSPQTTISFAGGSYTISGSAFYNNGNGAGNYTARLETYDDGTTNTITNTTFANNRNVITAVLIGGRTFTMTNVTISKNTSSDDSVAAGIVLVNGAILNMGNSILAGNTSPGGENNIGGAQPDNQFVSQGYNIIGNSFVTPVISGDTTGNLLGVDPLLDTAVRDNGGPTLTLSLLAGSPAIDAGNPTSFPATDQRGITRPQDGDGNGTSRSDIGAYEAQPPNTATGNDVTVEAPAGDASATFDSVTQAGFTIFAEIVSPSSAGMPPAGYTILDDAPAYDIHTTATYTAPITVCFTVNSITDADVFARVRILHGEDGVLVDRTDLSSLDFASHTVCAQVDSLSPFIIALAPPSGLLNISTRMQVLTGDQVLIGGFIITGTDPKTVIFRAIGPSLTDFGVAGALADPVLELRALDGSVIASNDNWTSNRAAIEATGLPPSKDLESAIVATLDPGAYTAIVSGKNDSTGVGLVDAYDLDTAAASELANISTRGFVATESNVMIGGFILGSESTVLVRAIGPSLTGFGVAGALEDPTLELRDIQGTLVSSNDNWKDPNQFEIEATGLQPSKDEESAVLETLSAGAYTAIVAGAEATTGVGLVEVYRLP